MTTGRHRHRWPLLLVAIAVALGVGVAPAGAVTPSSGLSITVPAGPTSLGSGGPGSTISGRLATVRVASDTAVGLGWTATVSLSSAFTVTQGAQSWTFPSSRVRYASGTATATSGLGLTVCVPGQASALTPATLTGTVTAFQCPAIVGLGSSVSWNPTVEVVTQSNDPSGTYTGTITHSVS